MTAEDLQIIVEKLGLIDLGDVILYLSEEEEKETRENPLEY